MALVGRVENRPMSTTSWSTYRVMVVRCLLCGKKSTFNVPSDYRHAEGDKVVHAEGDTVVADCQCYDDAPGGPHQPVRIIPND